MSLPVTNSQATAYAIDLNADGHPDNQLGSVFSVLASQGIDLQGGVTSAIAVGSVVHVLRLQSTDAGFANDPTAQADWYVGVPAPAPPKFDGTDTPVIDTTFAPGTFIAALAGGAFTSPSPATTSTPVSLPFKLAFDSTNAVTLDIQGSRLAFTTDNAGQMQGQINGAISQDDIATKFLPAWAQQMNATIQADPNSSTALTLKSLFDTGCAGQNGFANDGVIEVCELQENSLLQTLLAPDMQIDANGHYVPGNAAPNAISIGFRFTAVAGDRVFANGFELNP
ncbi:MAG: hypothetical protein JSS28_11730 [Proteobacteria bacterium]|nr:hypothetical protein [Pseudomonadota bacterium]